MCACLCVCGRGWVHGRKRRKVVPKIARWFFFFWKPDGRNCCLRNLLLARLACSYLVHRYSPLCHVTTAGRESERTLLSNIIKFYIHLPVCASQSVTTALGCPLPDPRDATSVREINHAELCKRLASYSRV